jgi:exodeoxyribonuclease V beta subunit
VFVPFSWDVPTKKPDRALFHDELGALTLDLAGSDETYERAGAERSGEAMRLLYVALTRAEFRCYLVWGAINGVTESPLFELLHDAQFAADKAALFTQNDQAIGATLQQLSGTGISVETMPTADINPTVTAVQAESFSQYDSRVFDTAIRDDWRVASFSSITSRIGHSFEAHDHDPDTNLATPALADLTELSLQRLSIFDFPRGAQAGTCLHDIFEVLDFASLDHETSRAAVQASLLRNGFPEKWLPAVIGMVANVVSAPLIAVDSAFNLAQLAAGSWQTELEFYLPIRQLDVATLEAIFAGMLDRERFEDYYRMLEQLSFRQSRGMLQGFIDMVFEHNGRFYLLDWKSNHLGMTPAAYDSKALAESMSHNAYVLQYHLYTLALDRLLKLKMPDYCYDRHFGGAIYVYLRGVEHGSAATGIFFERPSAAFVSRAAERMLG